MECVFRIEVLRDIFKFLRKNWNSAIILNNYEERELRKAIEGIRYRDDCLMENLCLYDEIGDKSHSEACLTAEISDGGFKNIIITDVPNKVKTSFYTLDEVLRKLGPYPVFPTDIKIKTMDTFDAIRYYAESLIYDNNQIKEEKEDMLKLLEIYKERKTKEIEHKYDREIQELEEQDEAQIFIMQAEETLKEMLKTETLKVEVNSDVVLYTHETNEKINKIVDTIREEKNELNTKISEIEALLELAPDYEEKIRILRDYEIIDKKKNIIL